jgi:multidrug efflux pump subunit AcrB
MDLQRFALRRPFTVLVLIAGVVLAAFYGLTRMSRDVFPPLGIPTIYVAQPYGGMDPAQMEGFLTYYYEYHFLYITGIEHVESKSIQGAALLKLQFYPGTDMSQAMSETVSYVNRARAFMPPGTVSPFVMRFDTGSVPVGYLVFSSATKTVGQIQDVALNVVRPLFATLPGVSAPPPFGGSARSIVVTVDPARTQAYNLSPSDIVTAIANADVISPSGNVAIGDQYPIVPVNSIVGNIKELESVPIRSGSFPSIFVRDVAKVTDGSDILTSIALVNGRPAVYIPVTKRADASTLSVVNLVKANMPKFQNVLPPDVAVSYQFDQSPFVTRAISGLATEAGLGALLTGLVVLLFLFDWRSALIVVLNIPISLLGAVFALWLTGETINLMTLGGLALAVGILVDMSTVAIENIHTHAARGQPIGRAVLNSGREVAVPLLIAMFCVLAVFIPSFAMEGAARALFVPLSLAVGFSMLVSYVLAITLVPILSVWAEGTRRAVKAPPLHGPEHGHPTAFGGLRNAYAALLRPLLSGRWVLAGAYFALTGVAIVALFPRLGTEIFPQVNAGQLQLRIRAPAGTRLERTQAYTQKTLTDIGQEVGPDNVALSLALIGVHASNYPINFIYLWNSGPQESVLQVQLKDGLNLDMADLRERLRARFAKDMPEVKFSFEPSDIVSRVMSFGSPTPIEVAVIGTNLNTDRDFADKVRAKLQTIPVLRDVQFGQPLSYPSINVDVDRERAGLLGVSERDVTQSLTPATSSSRFTQALYWPAPATGVTYQIQVEFPQIPISSLQDIGNVRINGGDKSVLLRNIASVKEGTAVGEYDRYNGQRMVSVTANIEGADLGTVAGLVQNAVAELGPPPRGVSVDVRGQVQPLKDLLAALRAGLLVAVAVIFLVLIANFESVPLALVTIATVPAVIAGVSVTLWFWGTTLNLESYMGTIMAVGVAIANAILLVSFAERDRRTGMTARDAAREGAVSRLRPILMTTCAMIAGMLPMALGLGQGGEQTAPLGQAVIGGLGFGTLATLLVLPAIFALVRARASRRSSSLDPDDPSLLSEVPH